MIRFFRERKARTKVRRLNRELAESEWSRGKTGNTITLLAISDITCSELLERIQVLQEGIKIMDSWRRKHGNLERRAGVYNVDSEHYHEVGQMLYALQDLTGLPKGRLYDREVPSIEDYRGVIRQLAALAVQR